MNEGLLAQPLVEGGLVHHLFNDIARRFPDREAVSGQSVKLTYREIRDLADKCGRAVSRQAGERQGPVAVCLDHTAKLPALFLGVMQSGRPYIYLDPSDPPALLEATIKKAGVALAIAGETVRFSGLPHLGIEEILANGSPETDGPLAFEDESPCCLMHTGGSTSQSRCVSISHRALLHNIANFRLTLGITPEDRLSQLASPKFVAANSAIYGALLGGACLCPFALKTRGFSEWIWWLGHERITILHTTPSLFRLLARYVARDFFPHLRAIKLGGEPLYRSDVELFKTRFSPSCVLVNGLGISEAGGNICHHLVRGDSAADGDGEIIPVGRALPGHEVMVVDEEGSPVAAGVKGEISARGEFLSCGYWNDPNASAANFRKIGSNSKKTELLTGDLGRMLPDGSLVHLGRRDRLIKIRGFRVDLNLVEAALLAFPGVKNAAVSFIDLPEHHGMIAAFVQLADKGATDADAIRQGLAKTLPDYMVPQRIVFLPALPLTAGGKLDRRELLNVLKESPRSFTGTKPHTALEQRLVAFWMVILNRERIGIHDNFFELGGDSLQAMEFVARLSMELGGACWPGLLLILPTIAQIAKAVENGLIETGGEPASRTLKVTLLRLRKGRRGAPLVFIPGGFGTENELAVCAGLLPCLQAGWPVWGIRLNLLAKNLQRPRSVAEIAGQLTEKLLQSPDFRRAPVLIGECQACALALETARQLEEKTGKPPTLILLDPWQPRETPPRNATANLPAAIVRYYRLLRAYRPCPCKGRIHLVCCETSPRSAEACLDWWNRRLHAKCELHVVPGDHHAYIRLHKESLSQTLNGICGRGTVGKWLGGF